MSKVQSPKSNNKKVRRILTGYAFLAPSLSGFLVFVLVPVMVSLYLSFCRSDIITPPRFIGLENFKEILQDKNFWYYLYNTFFFMLSIPLGMATALFMALLVNQKLKGIVFFRTVYFLPVVSSMVACALIWRWIYNPDFGLVNTFFYKLGIPQQYLPQWLQDTFWAKPAIIIMTVWQWAGYNMLLYLAALQGVPDELYEAASIDGASWWQKFIHITLPMLSFVNFFILVMSIIGGFQAFGVQYVMTNGTGGPAGATTTVVFNIYQNAFQWFKMGYASALAWILFIMTFAFTIIQWKYLRRNVHYE